ncbi:MAG: hypothetical protein AAGI68_14225 [Planctomycetota bacterium]
MLPKIPPNAPPSLIKASTYNAIAQALNNQPPVDLGGGPQAGGGRMIRVRNDSGADIAQFGVLGVGGVAIDPTSNAEAFRHGPVVLSGVVPVLPEHAGRFVVVQEPVVSGGIGRAVVSGVTRVMVKAEDSAVAVDVVDAETTYLAESAGGVGRVLWLEPPSGGGAGDPETARWALVALGGVGGDGTRDFRIAGHTAIGTGTNRWAYDLVEVQPERAGRYKDVTDGLEVTAYNRIEAGNDGVGVEGDGTNRDDLPPFMEVLPIGIGAVVRGWPVINCDGDPEWHFEVPNNPGGSCQ